MRAALWWLSYFTWGGSTTLLGAVIHFLGAALPFKVDPDGVIHWRALSWGIHRLIFSRQLAGAYTFGANVVWPDEVRSKAVRPRKHEGRHVWWFMVLGPLFLPAYGACAAYSLIRAGDVWTRNWFEQDAIRAETK
jgi:hypothetical protein